MHLLFSSRSSSWPSRSTSGRPGPGRACRTGSGRRSHGSPAPISSGTTPGWTIAGGRLAGAAGRGRAGLGDGGARDRGLPALAVPLDGLDHLRCPWSTSAPASGSRAFSTSRATPSPHGRVRSSRGRRGDVRVSHRHLREYPLHLRPLRLGDDAGRCRGVGDRRGGGPGRLGARRPRQDRGDRLRALRHHLGLHGGQCLRHRLLHHPADEEGRLLGQERRCHRGYRGHRRRRSCRR